MNIISVANENSSMFAFLDSNVAKTDPFLYSLQRNVPKWSFMDTVHDVSTRDAPLGQEVRFNIPRYGIPRYIKLVTRLNGLQLADAADVGRYDVGPYAALNGWQKIELRSRDRTIFTLYPSQIQEWIEGMDTTQREVHQRHAGYVLNSHTNLVPGAASHIVGGFGATRIALSNAAPGTADQASWSTLLPFSTLARLSQAIDTRISEELQIVITVTTNIGAIVDTRGKRAANFGAEAALAGTGAIRFDMEYDFIIPSEESMKAIREQMVNAGLGGLPKLQVSGYQEADTIVSTAGALLGTVINTTGVTAFGTTVAVSDIQLRCPFPVVKTYIRVRARSLRTAGGNGSHAFPIEQMVFSSGGVALLSLSRSDNSTRNNTGAFKRQAHFYPVSAGVVGVHGGFGASSIDVAATAFGFATASVDVGASSWALQANSGNMFVVEWSLHPEVVDQCGFMSLKNISDPRISIQVRAPPGHNESDAGLPSALFPQAAALTAENLIVEIMHVYYNLTLVNPDDGMVNQRTLT